MKKVKKQVKPVSSVDPASEDLKLLSEIQSAGFVVTFFPKLGFLAERLGSRFHAKSLISLHKKVYHGV